MRAGGSEVVGGALNAEARRARSLDAENKTRTRLRMRAARRVWGALNAEARRARSLDAENKTRTQRFENAGEAEVWGAGATGRSEGWGSIFSSKDEPGGGLSFPKLA